MRRLICAFVVRIWHKQVFSWRGLTLIWRTFVVPVTRGVLVLRKATDIQCYSLYLLLKYASRCSLSETVQGSSAFSATLWWGKGPKLAPKYASDNDQCRAVDGWSMPLQDLNDGRLQIAMFLDSPKPWYKLERILKILCKDNTCLF